MDPTTFDQKIAYFKQNMPPQYPILYTLKIIGSKWQIPILWHLMLEDGQHYNQLKRTVGNITNTMLTKSLRELERDGLVRRHSYETVPPAVTYPLTDSGKSLVLTMSELFDWGKTLEAQYGISTTPLSNREES
ncbi:winged helix-turn-helix transcriptional regulator [Levilactobacillus tongjiangensis]|uniref:Winged helix-turn-helix transcriptional regulator n=1 Tax=Levilactobacillus tongjiangensis TaxID=2486023 RepID=A0ABW1SR88_9LACO|nr:helix-turn-helix domain-containing protein [Levilactobacillus tongjiangensis]